MLKACHQRMLDLCDLLERMCDYQVKQGVDQAMTESARKVLRYFEIAAPHHHADEEENLFPPLRKIPTLHALLEKLTRDHQQHDSLWQDLKPCLQRIESGQSCSSLSVQTKAFVNAYRPHIKIENEQVLPQANQHLNAEELSIIGQAMAARRKN